MNLPAVGLLAILAAFFAYLLEQARIDEARADDLLDTDDELVLVDDWHGPDCDGCRTVAAQERVRWGLCTDRAADRERRERLHHLRAGAVGTDWDGELRRITGGAA